MRRFLYGCVAEADLDVDSALWLWHRAPRRGGSASFVGREDNAVDLYHVSGAAVADPMVHEWLECTQFRELFHYRFNKNRHVNEH